MGYYTDFKFKVTEIDNESQADKIIEELELFNSDVSNDGTKLTSSFKDKWYGWKEDFIAVSKVYPRILFEIDGSVEGSDDRWRARICDGVAEVIYAKITFDEFKQIR